MSTSCIVQVECSQGADLVDDFRFVERDDDGAYAISVGGVLVPCRPRDLSNSKLEGVIAPSAAFSTIIDHLTDADMPIDDAPNGHAAFSIKASRIATWPIGTWFFAVRQVVTSGALVELMRGPWIVSPRKFP